MKKFKLIGHKIQHSASPFIHNAIFQHFNTSKNYSYELLDLPPTKFENIFNNFHNLSGANITAPYKIAAFEKLNLISDNAKQFGCINTIKKLPNGKLKGYCTDSIGFMKTIELFNKNFFKTVLIIGYGGMGRMAAKCLTPMCKNLFVLIKNSAKLTNLRKQVKPIFINKNETKNKNFELIINAAPGYTHSFYNDPPIDLTCLHSVSYAFDLNYFPVTSNFLKQARGFNAVCKNGIVMLVWQAVAAQKIWNGFNCSNSFVNSLIHKTSNFLEAKHFE